MTIRTDSIKQPAAANPTPEPEPTLVSFVPFFKAFCNGTRASIVEQLLRGERCVCEITAELQLSQPLISHHLAILRETGFVTMRADGTRTYYAIDWERFDALSDGFRSLVADHRAHPKPGTGCS